MIVAVEGIVIKKDPMNCVLKLSNGISYSIIISLNCSAKLEVGGKFEFLTTQILREDANLLYGFLDRSEKSVFDMLIKVSGIGASTSMAVCSSLSADSFIKAVVSGDSTVLTSVPGIGPKTARRIIAELGDAKMISQNENSYQNEATLALESLGFKRDKINKILLECTSTNTADLVKEALKKIK